MAELKESTEAARRMVGETFTRSGRTFVVRRVVVEFGDVDTGSKHVSRYADGIDEFSHWINDEEVTDV